MTQVLLCTNIQVFGHTLDFDMNLKIWTVLVRWLGFTLCLGWKMLVRSGNPAYRCNRHPIYFTNRDKCVQEAVIVSDRMVN